jgi:hypothetical protein
MKKNTKAWIIGVIGVLVFLAGVFLPEIGLVTGIIVAIILWVIAGFLSGCCRKGTKETQKKK